MDVAIFLIRRIIIFFLPITDLLPSYLMISQAKYSNHFRTVKVEGIADTA